MKLFITKNEKEGDKKAFEIIKRQVKKKPNSLIGLAVGKTTDGLHKLISKDSKKNPKVWEKIKVFQIDENLSVSTKSKISFNYEVSTELKDLFKILNKENIFLIDGTLDPKKTIKSAYSFIRKNKGFDLITLGIGPEFDPHIAYNTTGKSLINSKMRVVNLHPKISKKLYEKMGNNLNSMIPTKGITLGIKDILTSKEVLLIAYGKDKAKPISLAFNGKVNMKKASASALQLHKNLHVVLDKPASLLLQNCK